MASIEKRKLKTGVSYVIVFYRNGKKGKVSFGKRYKLREVKTAQSMIESVLDSERTGEQLSRAAASYFENAPKDLLRRFACFGFGKARARLSIEGVWKAFEAEFEQTVKERTCDTYRDAFARLKAFFKTDASFDSISVDELKRFSEELKLKYAAGTVDQTISKLKVFSKWALKNGFADTDVFSILKRTRAVNKSRLYYVDRETARKILEYAPNDEWRLLFGCWRYVGMRREEPFGLTCNSFDFERKIVNIHATKTERCSNGGDRASPMFADFRRIIDSITLRDPLFTRIKKNSVYDGFRTIVKRAGLTPWSRLIQNLRASCENDLISVGFPNHVVATWIGHSVDVQEKHYLQVTSTYLDKATSDNLWDNL